MNPLGTLIFWLVALLTVVSAVMVVAARKILHAAFALAMCFLGVSGLYVFLHADFLAGVQLIVYVGGIIVLIMFAIMFSSHTQEAGGEGQRHKLALGAAAATAGLTLFAVIKLLDKLSGPLQEANRFTTEPYQHTVGVTAQEMSAQAPRLGLGHVLMGEYMLPFEVASVLILAALIGAVVIVRKETRN